MITSIEGVLTESAAVRAVIEANGLGYEVNIPITTAEKLPPEGNRVKLHTLAVYREDSAALYGFITREERDFFRQLVEKVSGIGPRIALSIMSKLSVNSLRHAIAQGDVKLLAQCPGIGKKTAERLVIELRDKVFAGGVTVSAGDSPGAAGVTNAPADSPLYDAVQALIALGYKPADADKSARKAQEALGAAATAEALIRASLGK